MTDNNDNPTMKQTLTKAITEPSEKTFLIGFFLITYVLLFPLRLSTFFPDNARLAIYVVLAIDGIVAYRLVLLTATKQEAYSAAGEIGFSWWLVEHYLPYHIDCPDGCVSGESAGGRKDSPGFEVGDGSFYYIPDGIDSFVESLLPLQ